MPADSSLDVAQMARARALLLRPRRRDSLWPAVAAAGFLAITALGFAAAMIMAPPLVVEHLARPAP